MAKRVPNEIDIASISISPLNVRKANAEERLEELAQSIKEHSLLQPVVVYKKDGKYELIIGQRRLLACRDILGWRKISARVIPVKSDTEAQVLSFSENIHRLDLDYRDKMNVATGLLADLGSVQKVAKKLNVNPATVREYLGYAGVPDKIKQLVSAGKLGAQTAIEIARSIPDEREAEQIAKQVIEAPRGDKRRAIIQTAKENPGKSAKQIVKMASKQKFKQVTLHLSPRVAEALEEACRDYKAEPKDIAIHALENWLKVERFLR